MSWSMSEIFSVLAFLVPPIASLLAFYLWKRRWICWSIVITIGVDLFVWGSAIWSSSYARGLAMIFLIPQIVVVTLVSLAIWRKTQKNKE